MSTSRRELVFLDSNVITSYFSGDERALAILESDYTFAITDIVYSEVAFNLLRAKYFEKHGRYSFYGMKKALARLEDYLVEAYSLIEEFLQELEKQDRLCFLPVTRETAREANEIARKYGLLPNDALIAAVCRSHGIKTIATFDEDFRRIPWLKVIP